MARRKPKPAEDAATLPPAADTAQPAPDDRAMQPNAANPMEPDATKSAAGEPQREWTSSLPDPFGRNTIDLGDGRRLQFSRSGRWQQMQIRFVATQEGVDPKPKKEDGDTQWLRERGWNWKGEAETKAWTVQLLRPEEKELPDDQKRRRRATVDRQAEQDFIELAQRIRERNGLPPAAVFASTDRGVA